MSDPINEILISSIILKKKLKGMKIIAKTIFFSRLKGTFLKGSVFHRELLTNGGSNIDPTIYVFAVN
jgi:hypothetical protein